MDMGFDDSSRTDEMCPSMDWPRRRPSDISNVMYTDDITAVGKGLGTFQERPMHEGLAQQGRRVAVYVRNCSRAGSREGDTEPEPTRIYRTHARTFQDVRLKPRIHPTRTRHQVEEDNG